MLNLLPRLTNNATVGSEILDGAKAGHEWGVRREGVVYSGVFAESTDEHSMPAPALGCHFRIKYRRAASMLLLFYMS